MQKLKTIFITILLLYITSTVHSQVYNYTWTDQNNNDIDINIVMTTQHFEDSVVTHVKRQTGIFAGGFEIDPYSQLEFKGRNIHFSENYAELDLSSTFMFIPFDPSAPILEINSLTSSSIFKIYSGDAPPTQAISNNEFIYWCSCRGDESSPEGCVSSFNGNLTICTNDENCNACVGWITKGITKMRGGGVILEVRDNLVITDDF